MSLLTVRFQDPGFELFLHQELARLGDLISGCKTGFVPRLTWLAAVGVIQYEQPDAIEHPNPADLDLDVNHDVNFNHEHDPVPPPPMPRVVFRRCDNDIAGSVEEAEELDDNVREGDLDDADLDDDAGLLEVVQDLDADANEGEEEGGIDSGNLVDARLVQWSGVRRMVVQVLKLISTSVHSD